MRNTSVNTSVNTQHMQTVASEASPHSGGGLSGAHRAGDRGAQAVFAGGVCGGVRGRGGSHKRDYGGDGPHQRPRLEQHSGLVAGVCSLSRGNARSIGDNSCGGSFVVPRLS